MCTAFFLNEWLRIGTWPFGSDLGAANGQEQSPPAAAYQCVNFQCQVIASTASSSRVTISSGSKAIGAHARPTLAVSQHTHAPNAQLENTLMRLRLDD